MTRPVKQQLGRGLAPDELREPPEAGDVAVQPALHEQLAEAGPLRRDPDVGHERQLHAPPDGGTVDRGDHGDVRCCSSDSGGRREPRLGAQARRDLLAEFAMTCFTSSPEQNAGSVPVTTRQRAGGLDGLGQLGVGRVRRARCAPRAGRW